MPTKLKVSPEGPPPGEAPQRLPGVCVKPALQICFFYGFANFADLMHAILHSFLFHLMCELGLRGLFFFVVLGTL